MKFLRNFFNDFQVSAANFFGNFFVMKNVWERNGIFGEILFITLKNVDYFDRRDLNRDKLTEIPFYLHFINNIFEADSLHVLTC